jgi:hypothetical protein
VMSSKTSLGWISARHWLDLINPGQGRLDDQQRLVVFLNRALPAIHANDPRNDIDTRCQLILDKFLREAFGQFNRTGHQRNNVTLTHPNCSA